MKKVNLTIMMLAMMVAALSVIACSSSSSDDEEFGNAQDGTIEGFQKTLCGKWELYRWEKGNGKDYDYSFLESNEKLEFKKDGSFNGYMSHDVLACGGTWNIDSFKSYNYGSDTGYKGIVTLTIKEFGDDYQKEVYEKYVEEYNYYKERYSSFEEENELMSYDEYKSKFIDQLIGVKIELNVEELFQNYLRIEEAYTIFNGKRTKADDFSEWRK